MNRAGSVVRWGVAVAVLAVAGGLVVSALDRSVGDVPEPIEVAVGADATVPDGALRQVEGDRVVAVGTGEEAPPGSTAAEPGASTPPAGTSDAPAPPGSPVGREVTAPVEGVLGPLPSVEVPGLPGLTTSTTGPLLGLLDEVPVLGSATTTTTAPSLPPLPVPLPPLPSVLDPLLVP